MSKYKERGPYHFVEYVNKTTPYHAHVEDFTDRLADIIASRDISVSHIHEVGCGEGLILHILQKSVEEPANFSGNDIDNEAIEMGKLLVDCDLFVEHDITTTKITPDVVIFSDSLEHITNWKAHIDWAKKSALIVALAWPSSIDRHAINEFSAPFFDQYFPEPWKCEYRKTRDHRHVTIWTRPDP